MPKGEEWNINLYRQENRTCRCPSLKMESQFRQNDKGIEATVVT